MTEEYLEQQERDARQETKDVLLQREASIVWGWAESRYEWSLEERFYFLIGLLESDGSVANGEVKLEMRSDLYHDVVRFFSRELADGTTTRQLHRNQFTGKWFLMAWAGTCSIARVREIYSTIYRFMSGQKQAQMDPFLRDQGMWLVIRPTRYNQQSHVPEDPLVPILKSARDAGQNLSDPSLWPRPFDLLLGDRRNVAWLCGVLVGDGCFTTNGGNPPVCRLRMSNKEVINRVSALLKANNRNDGPSRLGTKDLHRVEISGNKLKSLKDPMLPLLFKKRGERLNELFSSWKPKRKRRFDLPILNIFKKNHNNE